MNAHRNTSDENRDAAYLGGIVILFALIIVLMFLTGCAAPYTTRSLMSEAPFIVDFDEGTHWTFLRTESGVEQSLRSPPLDTLDIWVEEVLAPPRNPIMMEPLLNRPELAPPTPPGAGFYLPAAVPADTLDLLEPLFVQTTGPAASPISPPTANTGLPEWGWSPGTISAPRATATGY